MPRSGRRYNDDVKDVLSKLEMAKSWIQLVATLNPCGVTWDFGP